MLQKAAFLTLLLLAGCSEQPHSETLKFRGIAMTIPFEVQTEESVSTEDVSHVIRETFAYVDLHYNKFNPNSELSTINQSKAGIPLPLSEGLYTLLKETDSVWKLTHGYFDPTVEPAHKLWKEAVSQGKLPSHDELKNLSIGWDKVHLNRQSIVKGSDTLEIDLGGIAKGYAVDLLYERLKAANVRHLYVEWGGEIRVSKEHPDKRPWKIALNSSSHYVELSDQACATSGDYEQFWVVDGTAYFHILNPKTLELLQKQGELGKNRTVIAPTCTLADGIATTLFFFEGNELEDYVKELKDSMPSLKFIMLKNE
jgi:thiamine biosynthesis lipoprotein